MTFSCLFSLNIGETRGSAGNQNLREGLASLREPFPILLAGGALANHFQINELRGSRRYFVSACNLMQASLQRSQS